MCRGAVAARRRLRTDGIGIPGKPSPSSAIHRLCNRAAKEGCRGNEAGETGRRQPVSENTKLWDILGRTDPTHTKSFKRAGGFSGTAIKPMWAYKRMTEEFGPIGFGWGVGQPSIQVVAAGDEIIVYCTASVWFKSGEVLSQPVD